MATGSIEIVLVPDIVYVAGIINDKEYVFIQDEVNLEKWRATVDIAPDNIYDIHIEMHDAAGNISYYNSTTEYIIPWFITDRTQDDVDLVRAMLSKRWTNFTNTEKTQWLTSLKGALNKSDLKRIENDIFVLAQMSGISITTRKDNLPTIPDSNYFEQLKRNVQALRDTKRIYVDTPQVPDMPFNDYRKFNDIEQILSDVYNVLMSNYTYYCGTDLYSGNEIGLI